MKIARILSVAFVLVFAGPAVINAQPADAAEAKAYRLHQIVVVGSQSASGDEKLTPDVSSAIEDLRPELGFRSYSTMASVYGSLGHNGQAQWKLITKKLGSFGSDSMPVISEWSLGALELVPGNPGLVEFRRFLFVSRVPAKFGGSVNYENIQLMLNRVRVPVGKASVIGNLPVSDTGEMLIFVVKIEEAR